MAAGRTLLVNASLAWRWGFLIAGTQGNDTVHRRFWSDGVRWLAEGKSGGQLEIFADQAAFLAGRQVTLGARLTRDDLEPIGDAEVKVELVPGAGGESGATPATNAQSGAGAKTSHDVKLSAGGNGQYAGAADPALPSGFYRLRGEAVRGERRWTAEGDPFLIDEASLEGLTPAADPGLLRRIAEASTAPSWPPRTRRDRSSPLRATSSGWCARAKSNSGITPGSSWLSSAACRRSGSCAAAAAWHNAADRGLA